VRARTPEGDKGSDEDTEVTGDAEDAELLVGDGDGEQAAVSSRRTANGLFMA